MPEDARTSATPLLRRDCTTATAAASLPAGVSRIASGHQLRKVASMQLRKLFDVNQVVGNPRSEQVAGH